MLAVYSLLEGHEIYMLRKRFKLNDFCFMREKLLINTACLFLGSTESR